MNNNSPPPKESLLGEQNRSPSDGTVRDQYSLRLGYLPLRFHTPHARHGAVGSLPVIDPNLSPVTRRSFHGTPSFLRRHARSKSMNFEYISEEEENDFESLREWYEKKCAEEESELFDPEEEGRDYAASRWKFCAAGSTLSSVFNLSSATLGAGALSIPFAFRESGLILGILLLAIAAMCTVYSIRLLIQCRQLTRLSSYEDLATYCFGRRMAVFVELNIAVFCFGTSVAYLIAAGDIIHPLVTLVFPEVSRTVIVLVFGVAVVLPLSFVENISSMRFTSFIGVIAITVLVGTISAISAYAIATGNMSDTVDWTQAETYFRPSTRVFSACSILMFAFTCQVNVFSIYTELTRPCVRKMSTITNMSTFSTFLLYLFIGTFGFIQNGADTQSGMASDIHADPQTFCPTMT